MNTASILIKTDPKLKKAAQETADEMGISLTSVINRYLKHFIDTKTITFTANDEVPNAQTIKALKASEEDIKARRVSPAFKNAEDAIKWLEDPNARFQNGDKV
jgi:addiction module RelB/DinJ family antitoxin